MRLAARALLLHITRSTNTATRAASPRAGSCSGLVVRLVRQLLDEQRQVVACELPLEGSRRPFVAALKGGEAVRDLDKVFEVVRREDLALDDAEENLDLVQPRSVNGQLDEGRVRPALERRSQAALPR